jgi:hypothetical protein
MDGPHAEAELENVSTKLDGLSTTPENSKKVVIELRRQQLQLQERVQIYHDHLKQYQVCRNYVDRVRDTLKENECLVFRDFVNQHNVRGEKVNNLVLVVFYRDSTGVITKTKINNFCKDPDSHSCDAYYVQDVFDFHLRKDGDKAHRSDLFSKFSKIYISGDHGPHFSSVQTIFNESRMKFRYDKEIEVISLCSYHAYNVCDAAGAESKVLARARAKEGLGLISAEDYEHERQQF